MQPAKLNLTIKQGATFRKRLTWRGSNKKPINLTGYTAKMQARSAYGDPQVLFELSTENGGITLGGTAGTVELYTSDEATALFNFERALYDLFLYAPNGDALPLFEGNVRLVLGVTRV